MGFLDKLKSLKNVVTGGAAKVYLDCPKIAFDAPFTVTVRAVADDAPVKINRVYLKICGTEDVEVPDVDVVYDEQDNPHRRREVVCASRDTVEFELTVANALEMAANQTLEWEVEVTMPAHAPAFYRGYYCKHAYYAFAGLDCFGNDPDSGWQELKE